MRRTKILLAACAVGLMAASTLPVTGAAAVPALPTSAPVATGTPLVSASAPQGASKYVSVAPLRLADTRTNPPVGYSVVSSNVIRVGILDRAGVPAGATAAVLNITIAGSSAWGYVTVFPAGGSTPDSSNVNVDGPGRVVANLVHVKIGAGGAADIFRSTAMGLVVDLVGVYVPVTAGGPGSQDGRLVTLPAGAQRVLDTRGQPSIGGGQTRSVDVATAGVPANASAVVVNLTVVDARVGYWSAIPDGQSFAATSSLNVDRDNQTRAGQAIVNLSASRRFNVYTESGGKLLVDVVGYFTGVDATVATDTAGLFVASSPLRMFDSRAVRTLPPWSASTYEFPVGNPASIQVAAAVMNITATSPWDLGFVTAYPAGVGRPNSSNLNVSAAPQTIANQAIVRVSTRGVALFTQGGSHLIADVAGWYLGVPTNATQPAPSNPVYSPNAAFAVYVPKIGVFVRIKAGGGNLDRIADEGYAATWSDINTVAAPGNVMLFGHRTTGSAPFRYLDNLNNGDEFIIVGSDQHSYHYQVMGKDVTRPTYSVIQRLASPYGPLTAQLVACSKPDGSATSTAYRIVVTGRLVSVT